MRPEKVLGAPPYDVDAPLLFWRDRGVALQNLSIAEHRVERRAQLVAQADQIAALGEVGRLGHFLGLLQGCVGAAVRLDLAQQQRRLAGRFFLRHTPALMRQHQEPGEDAGHDHEDEEGRPQRAGDGIGIGGCRRRHLEIDQPQCGADQHHEDGKQAEELDNARTDPGRQRFRQQGGGDAGRLRLQPRLRLAQVVAAGVERAAQRADRPRIGRAEGHVLGLEFVFADGAADTVKLLPIGPRLARQVVFALGRPSDGWCCDEWHEQRDEDGKRLRRGAEQAGGRGECQRRRNAHGADADRVDVEKMRPLELDSRRRQAEALVDGKIGDDRAQPGDGDDGKQAERHLQRPVDAEFHQHQRDGDVEDQPDDAAGMAVGEPREEVRPGQRPGIGVHDVDLELRHHDEGGGQEQHEILPGNHIAEGDPVHLGGLGGMLRRNPVAERQHRQERAEEQLRRPQHHPAGPGDERADMPLPARALGGQEAQHVHLLADLRHQRQDDGGRGAELQEVEAGVGRAEAGKIPPDLEAAPVLPGDEADRQDVEPDPQRLGDDLEAADARHAVGDQRDDRDRADDIADGERNAEADLKRRRHDRGFDGEQDEGEGGVDQRGDGRADIAEAGAAG